VGNVDSMPFIENNTFNWVLCQQGFQFFDDQPGALREFYRVLRSGGRLAMIMTQPLDEDGTEIPYGFYIMLAAK
jgi:ubiquinone/menaquinone biosynthesis C-methylase UbiE